MSKSFSYSFRKLLSFLWLVIIFCSNNFSAFAQTRRAGQPASAVQVKQSAQKCSGAWTGTINYARTQTMRNNKTVDRVSGRGQDSTDFQMNYNYNALVAVSESPGGNSASVGKANINLTMNSHETVVAREKNSCDRGKSWQEMTGTSNSNTETTGTGKEEANVNVGVNSDGTYAVSVGLPQIKGKVSGSQSSSFSGQCTAKEGKNLNLPPTETSIDGQSLTSDGTTRVNPSDPNRISGSYILKLPGDAVETISWNLRKCGAPLRITDLKFEDMKFPNWNDWKEIVEQTGTIDGNLIKIKATVLNASGEDKYADLKFKETYKGDKWDGARPDGLLENGETSVKVAAGEAAEVELLWDSSGYSWFDDGRPRLVQRIKAELEENSKKTDEMTKNLKVAPKPLVLVHGAWSHWKEFETWQNILTTSHSYDWKAFPVGENIDKGIINTGREFLSSEETNTTAQNAESLKSYIKYAQEDRNAWHVDVVAHSIGGLISRYYISRLMPANYQDGRPQIDHLVMLGTPNMGSTCADVMDFAFNMTGKSPRVVSEMRQDAVAEFNKTNFNRKGVKFSALAGNPLPTMCKAIEWNDGFVSVPSAKWTIKDTAETKSLHTEMTGTKDFSDFVKSRVAVGPKGDHNPAAPSLKDYPNQIGQTNRNAFGVQFIGAAYKSQDSQDQAESFTENRIDEKPDFAKAVKLAPKQLMEIEIPIVAANDFGLTFMADATISATLYNDKSEIVGKNLTNTPESGAWFRSIYLDKNTTAGIWKLKLENFSDRELPVIVAAWHDARN